MSSDDYRKFREICPRAKCLVGQRFGRLLVVGFAGKVKNNKYWRCLCDCGQVKGIQNGNLTRGKTRSCGCLGRELAVKRSTTHGKYGTAAYDVWNNMLQRCRNPRATGWKKYGGRGIRVCERWQSLDNFIEDMGMRPAGRTLERINNDGNYEPQNCKWATIEEQSRNTRRNRWVIFRGETLCVADWAKRYSLNFVTLWSRLFRYGWTVEAALTTPVG